MGLAVGGGADGGASRITPWDEDHVLAWSLSQAAAPSTIANEGSGGTATLNVTDTYNPAGSSAGPYHVWGAPSPFGNSLWRGNQAFNGFNARIDGAATAVTPTTAITIEAWVFNPYINPTARVFDKPNAFRLEVASGSWQASVWIGGAQRTVGLVGGPLMGAWTHIGVTYESGSTLLKGWANGIQAGQNIITAGTLTTNTTDLISIGAYNSGSGGFQGGVARAAVSKIARPAAYWADQTQKAFGWMKRGT